MSQRRLILGPVAIGLALVLTALPATPDLDGAGFDGAAALAKPGGGNGNGNGNGNGGGRGGGKGHARGDIGKKSARDLDLDLRAPSGKAVASKRGGKAFGHGHGLGHAKVDKHRDAVSGIGHGLGKSKHKSAKHDGLSASSLGRLNAAHASPRARERAAPHSAVGLLGQYADAVEAGDLEAAAAALAAAANKDIDPAVVGAVNDLLGLEVDEATEQEIADLASQAQAGETDNGLGHGRGPSSPGDDDAEQDGNGPSETELAAPLLE